MPHSGGIMSLAEPGGAETAGRESLRAFVAVAPGAPLRDALGHARASLESAKFAPGLRWVRPENLHLTLRFLGEGGASLQCQLGPG